MDIAELGISVESSGVDKAIASLKTFTDWSYKAEAASSNIGKSANVGIGGIVQRANQATGALKLTHFQLQNIGYQLNDIASGLLMGQSPFMILRQQSGQIVQALQQGPGGLIGSLKAVGLAARGFFLNPITLAFAGVAALAGGYYLWLNRARQATLDATDVMEKHKATVVALKDAYGDAADGIDAYTSKSKAVADAMRQSDIERNRTLLQQQTTGVLNQKNTLFDSSLNLFQTNPRTGAVMGVAKEYSYFSDELMRLRAQAQQGKPDVLGFLDAVAKTPTPAGEAGKSLREARDRLLDFFKAAGDDQGRLEGLINGFTNVAAVTASFTSALKDLNSVANAPMSNEDKIASAYHSALMAAQSPGDRASADASYLAAMQRNSYADIPLPTAKPNMLGEEEPGATEAKRLQDQLEKQRKQQLQDAYDRNRDAQNSAANANLLPYQRQSAEIGQKYAAQSQADAGNAAAIALDNQAEAAERAALAYQTYQQPMKAANLQLIGQIDALKVQAATFGMSTSAATAAITEQQKLNDLMQSGAPITDDARKGIHDYATAMGEVAQATEDLTDKQQKFLDTMDLARSTTNDFLGGTIKALETDGSVKDAFKGSANKLIGSLTDQSVGSLTEAFLGKQGKAGGGLFGDALGSLFGKPDTSKIAELSTFQNAMWVQIKAGDFGGQTSPTGAANDNVVTRSMLPPLAGANDNQASLGQALSMVGNYKQGVDPRLTDILNHAAMASPFKVDAVSGYRAGDPRFHGQGLATDVSLIDPATGKALPNYQNGPSFRSYEQYAQTARAYQQQAYPELNDQFRWGGYFGGKPGTYGAADLMHFDLGGSSRLGMAGGSWVNGATQQQLAMYPGAQSQGIGTTGMAQLDATTTKLNTNMTAFADSTANGTDALGAFGGGLGQLGSAISSAAGGSTGGGLAGLGVSLAGKLLGGLGGMFGGFSPQAPAVASSGAVGLFANGTDSAPGGLAWVGERGPELVNLSKGSQVYSNDHIAQAVKGSSNNDGGSGPSTVIQIQGDASPKNLKNAVKAIQQNNAQLARRQNNQWRTG